MTTVERTPAHTTSNRAPSGSREERSALAARILRARERDEDQRGAAIDALRAAKLRDDARAIANAREALQALHLREIADRDDHEPLSAPEEESRLLDVLTCQDLERITNHLNYKEDVLDKLLAIDAQIRKHLSLLDTLARASATASIGGFLRRSIDAVVREKSDELHHELSRLRADRESLRGEIDLETEYFLRFLKRSEHDIALREYNDLKTSIRLERISYGVLRHLFTDRRDEHQVLRDAHLRTLIEKKRALRELEAKNPEAYYLIKSDDYLEQIAHHRRGEIVDVPSVAQTKEWLLDKMENGHPVFLTGHLGAGKSEIARTASLHHMVDLHIEEDLRAFLAEHPNASGEALLAQYDALYQHYLRGLKRGDREVIDKIKYYEVVGSRTTTTEDLYTETALVVKAIGAPLPHEISDKVDAEFALWRHNHPTVTDADELTAQRAVIESAVAGNNQTQIATESAKVRKALYKAITEGKPIVIDEINLIMPEVLASMNDILTKRPGEKAIIPGDDAVTIANGFSIIMTGNLNSSSKMAYAGVNSLNAAYLSRLSEKAYDYVTQSKEGNLGNQRDPRLNELFYIVMTKLADERGNLELPQGAIDDIFRLCQLARITQDVFSGKWEESAVNADVAGDSSGEKPSLDSYVLSVRHVLRVIEAWDEGSKRDISMALWDEFLGSISGEYVKDQHFIAEQAKLVGLFSELDGWRIDTHKESVEHRSLTLDDIRTKAYTYKKQRSEFFSLKQMIDLLYGEPERRSSYPQIYEALEATFKDEITEEEFDALEQKLNELCSLVSSLESLIA